MNKKTISAIIAIAICVSLGALVSYAGGSGGVYFLGQPVFVLCAFLAFLINWLAFVPAYISKTEHYYDLTGSFTYLSVVALAVVLVPALDERAKVVACLVVLWAIRLGTFLFRRIQRDGGDDRFDEIKTNPARFLTAWTIQALWVVVTAACALTVITSERSVPIGFFAYLGILLWVFGFITEVVADQQKSSFKKNPDNRGRFIQSGLWSWSRHPNYFGEIVLWCGIAVIALPVLSGWQWLVLCSPVFVFLLINYVSGVNKLEDKAEKKWGDDPDYLAYRQRTSKLFLLPPK
jgi:steroid 5-alpha reductase family enzyme